MRRAIGRILKWIGAVTVISVLLLVYVGLFFEEGLPEEMILEVDFRKAPVEYTGDHPLASLWGERLTLREQVLAIVEAASDDRVVGILARVGGRQFSLAHIQEYAEAVQTFRKSGKRAVVFAESIGGFLPANGSYALASSFGEISIQPSGGVGLVGLFVEHPFFRGTLDSLGIVPVFAKREDYKLAPNVFTERGFTDGHREEMKSLLEDQFDQIVSHVASGREKTPDIVHGWVEAGPFDGQEALDQGLVDRLQHIGDVRASFLERDEDAKFVKLKRYAGDSKTGDGEPVALIYGVGTIESGASRYNPVEENQTVGSDTIVDAFSSAVEDGVSAIIFRVDSPGGGYSPSRGIWQATRIAQEAGIPVIVSMGATAASGGYLVATHADKVIAQPGTVTGSIGVWAGKFVTPELWKKLGVTWDTLKLGKNAAIASSLSVFSPGEKAKLDGYLDRVYVEFTEQVGEGRQLNPAQLDRSARGRVWTGRQALGQGLVDRLGGFLVAVEETKETLDVEKIELVVYPKPKELAERILSGDWEDLSYRGQMAIPLAAAHDIAKRISDLLAGPVAWVPGLGAFKH